MMTSVSSRKTSQRPPSSAIRSLTTRRPATTSSRHLRHQQRRQNLTCQNWMRSISLSFPRHHPKLRPLRRLQAKSRTNCPAKRGTLLRCSQAPPLLKHRAALERAASVFSHKLPRSISRHTLLYLLEMRQAAMKARIQSTSEPVKKAI